MIDPWGTVVAQCREGTDVCVAEVDLGYLSKVREQMPVTAHRRHDLYGHIHVTSPGKLWLHQGKVQVLLWPIDGAAYTGGVQIIRRN